MKEFVLGFAGIMVSWIGTLEWRLRTKVNKNHFDDSIGAIHHRINELRTDMKDEFQEVKEMIRNAKS